MPKDEARSAMPDAAQAAELGKQQLAALTDLQGRMMKAAMTFNEELLAFTRRRLDRDMETGQRLGKCKDPAEAFQVMSDFYREALDNYTEEAKQLMALGQKAMTEAMETPKS